MLFQDTVAEYLQKLLRGEAAMVPAMTLHVRLRATLPVIPAHAIHARGIHAMLHHARSHAIRAQVRVGSHAMVPVERAHLLVECPVRILARRVGNCG